jgi:hypothetical protein
VDIVGGFRPRDTKHLDQPGPWLRRGVTFRYRVRGRGLELSWDAQAGDRYRVMTWARGGRFTPSPGGITVGNGRHVFNAPPAEWTVGSVQGGCCALDVRAVGGELVAPAPGPLTWRIEASHYP